jgi:SAM-dependent methyltransferase
MSIHANYDNFSWLYNQEWTYMAENVFPLLKHLAGEYLPEGGSVLDLCCGTGQLARVLTEKGYKVTGIDISAGQLRFARKNAPAARFIRADARSFKLNRKFNAVFSTFDALNHILTLEDLVKVFKNVSNCLEDNGIFIFDMITKREFEIHFNGYVNITEKPDFFYTVHNDYNPEKALGQVYVTLFRKEGKSWKRSDTVVPETFYTETQVRSALKKAGIRNIFVCAADPSKGISAPDTYSTRVYYFARKA